MAVGRFGVHDDPATISEKMLKGILYSENVIHVIYEKVVFEVPDFGLFCPEDFILFQA